MASTDHVKMNAQPSTSCQLKSTPGGRLKFSLSKLSSEDGLKNGRMTRRTSGIMVRTPSTVANVAPSRMPSQHGMNMTSKRSAATTNTSTGTSAPNRELIGPNEPPNLMSNRSTM